LKCCRNRGASAPAVFDSWDSRRLNAGAPSTNVQTFAHSYDSLALLKPQFLRTKGLVEGMLLVRVELEAHTRGSRNLEMNAMKTALLALCFLAATAAFGQSVASVGEAPVTSTVQMSTHAERATQHAMAEEQTLLEHSNYDYAQGERPLWEVQGPSTSHPVPLGDIARAYRKDHELVKKADIVVHD